MCQAHKVVSSLMIDYGGRKHDYRELSPLCRKAIDQFIGMECKESPLGYSYSTFMVPAYDILSKLHEHCVRTGGAEDFGEWLIEYEFDKVADPRREIWPVIFTDAGEFLDGYKRLRSYVSRGMALIPVIAVL